MTRGWCVTEFGVARDTAGRDLKGLTVLGLLELAGKGRAVHYVLKSNDNRLTQSKNRPMIFGEMECVYDDAIEDLLIENRRDLIQVTGLIVLDDAGAPSPMSMTSANLTSHP